MSGNEQELAGPDLASGIPASDLADGASLLGHANGEAVLLVRRGSELFAIGATCTHYNGPLAEGLIVDDTVRCPWHHACFSLRTGEALRAPALNPVSCWNVEVSNSTIFVRGKLPKRDAAEAGEAGPSVEIRRDHWRRRCRQCGRRDAPPARLRGQRHDAQRRYGLTL